MLYCVTPHHSHSKFHLRDSRVGTWGPLLCQHLGQSNRVSERKKKKYPAKSFFATMSLCSRPSSHKTSKHAEILFGIPCPNYSLFLLDWFSWSVHPCLRVTAGPCSPPFCVTCSLKMFTIEELPFVAFSLFFAWACNCCIVVCVCTMTCFEHVVSGLGVNATCPQSAIFDDADMQMTMTSC